MFATLEYDCQQAAALVKGQKCSVTIERIGDRNSGNDVFPRLGVAANASIAFMCVVYTDRNS